MNRLAQAIYITLLSNRPTYFNIRGFSHKESLDIVTLATELVTNNCDPGPLVLRQGVCKTVFTNGITFRYMMCQLIISEYA